MGSSGSNRRGAHHEGEKGAHSRKSSHDATPANGAAPANGRHRSACACDEDAAAASANGAAGSSNAGGRGVSMEFEITSDYAEGRNVEKQILDAAQRCGFAGNTLFAIKLALEEAMINAIKHGNKLDRSKKVYVQAEVNAKRIKITIQDEGPGFKRHDVPDPTAEENLTKCSGRGILLMEAYMNQVKFTRRGRCVCMIKKNEAANGE